ncbi:hypothetical protein F8271_10400 [Micromonospora sp. ALFpr18c]|uniref:hypothetical protein n=1 Tax=Micromonospora sp. ALFpr18c TaxID=1458665 RepID=UPI00124B7A81|nr:hypothetical protein [Micromonospora sp. ALFpr18c]KAB1943170.1 hypothetical protein F8271_10400 [Micromonospora sp. ALFpr18c]
MTSRVEGALTPLAGALLVRFGVGFAAAHDDPRPAVAVPHALAPAPGNAGQLAALRRVVTPPSGRYQPATTEVGTRPAVTVGDPTRRIAPRRQTAADRW